MKSSILGTLALALAGCGAAPPAALEARGEASTDVCAELDEALPRIAVRATATGWERTSDAPIEGFEDARTIERSSERDGIVIAGVGDGAGGAYGECGRGAFAVCGESLVVLLAPDYVFELTIGEGRTLVETQRLAGSQLGEAERMERDEPLTATRIWQLTPRGYRRADAAP